MLSLNLRISIVTTRVNEMERCVFIVICAVGELIILTATEIYWNLPYHISRNCRTVSELTGHSATVPNAQKNQCKGHQKNHES